MTAFKDKGRFLACHKKLPVHSGGMEKVALGLASPEPTLRARDAAMQGLAP